MEQEKIGFSAESVRSQFTLLTIFWWVGFPLSLLNEFFLPIAIISIPPLITATVFWCILLYRHWYLLQGHGARITPGKAVGFGFIPFFCFYWWFVAYVGLATDNNKYLNSIGVSVPRMSRELAITDCILSILGCTIGLLPIVGIAIMIPYMIIGFILARQQRDCVLAMLNYRTQNAG